MNNEHLVSVLMPVFNAEQYLKEAVQSILDQTHKNLELLCIDDGSTDRSAEILKQIGDTRLRVISNSSNQGIVPTLNRGLLDARSEYIARMDADDIAYPERLERQVAFLDAHPDVAVVGSAVYFCDEHGRRIWEGPQFPEDSHSIAAELKRDCCIIHPSVMLRKSRILELGGYDPVMTSAEDYDLWLRVAEKHALANLPEHLLGYRMHPGQISIIRVRAQNSFARICRERAIARRGDEKNRHDWSLPGRWQSLFGPSGSLGRDYIDFSSIQLGMGQKKVARALAFRALSSSPLCREAYGLVFRTLLESSLAPEQLQALRWYVHRIGRLTRRQRKIE